VSWHGQGVGGSRRRAARTAAFVDRPLRLMRIRRRCVDRRNEPIHGDRIDPTWIYSRQSRGCFGNGRIAVGFERKGRQTARRSPLTMVLLVAGAPDPNRIAGFTPRYRPTVGLGIGMPTSRRTRVGGRQADARAPCPSPAPTDAATDQAVPSFRSQTTPRRLYGRCRRSPDEPRPASHPVIVACAARGIATAAWHAFISHEPGPEQASENFAWSRGFRKAS
jgi:hypothetical protein